MSNSNELQTFNFNSHAFRVITGNNGEPWFIAKDVAECLGYQNPAEAIRDNCKKSVNFTNRSQLVVNEIKELHRTKSLIIPESDVYRLIMRSNLPSAEDFQTLVCEEILPSIRKTGGYQSQSSTPSLPSFKEAIEGVEALANYLRLPNSGVVAKTKIQTKPYLFISWDNFRPLRPDIFRAAFFVSKIN
jgi:prophage antirepressor-like protein